MPAMTKRVNVRTVVAVRTTNPPISGTYKNVIMTTSDILKCLCRRAHVEEILPNGKTIKLNMHNYYLDNGAGLDARKPKVEEKKTDKKKVSGKNAVVKNAEKAGIKLNAIVVDPPTEEEEDKAPADPEVVENKQPEEQVVETTESVITEEAGEPKAETAITSEEATDDVPSATSGYIQAVDLDDNGNPVQNAEDPEGTITVTATTEEAPAKKTTSSNKKKKK